LRAVVEPLADADAAKVRIDAHFEAVEPVAGRIVARSEAVVGDLVPAVRASASRSSSRIVAQ
jgi:hypothetical protein